MSAQARAGETGAMNVWSGTIPGNLPWRESFYVLDTDGAYSDLTNLAIKIYLRDCRTGGAVLSLSTADSTIIKETLTDDAGNSIPTFRPAASDVSSLCGDYYGDIVTTDDDDVDHYWASGIVTVTPNPAEA